MQIHKAKNREKYNSSLEFCEIKTAAAWKNNPKLKVTPSTSPHARPSLPAAPFLHTTYLKKHISRRRKVISFEVTTFSSQAQPHILPWKATFQIGFKYHVLFVPRSIQNKSTEIRRSSTHMPVRFCTDSSQHYAATMPLRSFWGCLPLAILCVQKTKWNLGCHLHASQGHAW